MAKQSPITAAVLLGATAVCTVLLLLAVLGIAQEIGDQQRADARLETTIEEEQADAARPLMREAWADARMRCLATQD